MPKTQEIISKKSRWLTKPTAGHLVQFYNSEDSLLTPLCEFISSGLRKNETCILIATPFHIQSLQRRLIKRGIDSTHFQARGQFVVLDAAETLRQFMVNDLPDRDLFYKVVGPRVQKALRGGKPLRASGEMVALLWKVGNREAVMQLENLWNELGEAYAFSLFCAYPELHFIMDYDVMDEIKSCHNVHLVPMATS